MRHATVENYIVYVHLLLFYHFEIPKHYPEKVNSLEHSYVNWIQLKLGGN